MNIGSFFFHGSLALQNAAGLAGLVLGKDLIIRRDAEENPVDFQLCLGHHAEALYLQDRGGGLKVDIAQGEYSAAAAQHHAHGE